MTPDTPRGGPTPRYAPGAEADLVPRIIRMLRTRLGLTTSELARRVGITPAFVSLIERGRKRPGEETAVRLARALGLEPGTLLSWIRVYNPTSVEASHAALDSLREHLVAELRRRPAGEAKDMLLALGIPEALAGLPPGRAPEGTHLAAAAGAAVRDAQRGRRAAGFRESLWSLFRGHGTPAEQASQGRGREPVRPTREETAPQAGSPVAHGADAFARSRSWHETAPSRRRRQNEPAMSHLMGLAGSDHAVTRELIERLLERPDIAARLLEHSGVAEHLLEQPDIAERVFERSGVAERLLERPEIVRRLVAMHRGHPEPLLHALLERVLGDPAEAVAWMRDLLDRRRAPEALGIRVPVLPEGEVPFGDPAAVAVRTVRLDPALTPAAASLRLPFACEVGPRSLAFAGPLLQPGDLAVVTRDAWPPPPGALLAVRLGRRLVLTRAALKGDALVLLPGEPGTAPEMLPVADPGRQPDVVLGRVALVDRKSVV